MKAVELGLLLAGFPHAGALGVEETRMLALSSSLFVLRDDGGSAESR